MCLLGFLLALLCLDTTSFCYFSTSTETQFQVRYLHFWPLKTACWTSKTTFGSKFLSFARAEQMLLIYRRIQWFVSRMCNRRNAKRTTFHGKTTPFTAQKGSFCNAKEAWLQCKRGFFALLNDNFRRAKKPLFMFWGDWNAFVDDKNRPWNL